MDSEATRQSTFSGPPMYSRRPGGERTSRSVGRTGDDSLPCRDIWKTPLATTDSVPSAKYVQNAEIIAIFPIVAYIPRVVIRISVELFLPRPRPVSTVWRAAFLSLDASDASRSSRPCRDACSGAMFLESHGGSVAPCWSWLRTKPRHLRRPMEEFSAAGTGDRGSRRGTEPSRGTLSGGGHPAGGAVARREILQRRVALTRVSAAARGFEKKVTQSPFDVSRAALDLR